ncbi:dihydrofolate reductase [Arthrobacter agilis]|uniref:dihydrofolate reductase family protein n=1 Tax=Arthrobacter agilis TaxID=37921 RepID=UPI000B34B8B3|nr:dihydrofolate reductase family protein [Arthrobacter agilis]OUM42223.1 deaminase [Arthrobacter agilis]PPB45566.1 deaminase [Arthrobacter agilis]TPV26454.1 dihydrofolate reductase [Arthrobacter agilis]VDR33646.1 RibD C-terminal domain [Arthrobacter agilis]
MRRVTAGLFSSVDGVVESPHLWQLDSFDAELGAGMGAMISRVDTVLLGRHGYEEWAEYWPAAEAADPFGSFINPVEKFVASRTLSGQLGWTNASLMDQPLEDFVRALRQTEGGEIAVCASISLVRQLLFAGLLDSLMLMTHPVVAGAGRHLFGPSDPVTRLELQDVTTTSRGNVLASYGLRPGTAGE